MATAHIQVGESCHLVLSSGGRSYHLKAASEGECQRWVSALQQAQASATLLMPQSGSKPLGSSLELPNDSVHLFERNCAGHLER